MSNTTVDIKLLNREGKQVRATQIAPGLYISRELVKAPAPDMVGIVELQQDPATGALYQVIVGWEQTMRVTRHNYHELGLQCNYNVFYKLCRAGMIKTRRISPDCLEIFPSSLAAHLRSSEDPEYWTQDRVDAYQSAAFDTIRAWPSRSWRDRQRERDKRKRRPKKSRRHSDFKQLNFDF